MTYNCVTDGCVTVSCVADVCITATELIQISVQLDDATGTSAGPMCIAPLVRASEVTNADLGAAVHVAQPLGKHLHHTFAAQYSILSTPWWGMESSTVAWQTSIVVCVNLRSESSDCGKHPQ